MLTSYQGDAGAGRGASSPEAGNGAQVGVGTILVHMLEWAKANIPSHPVGVNVFRALVDGEGNGSDESDAGEGSGNTYMLVKAELAARCIFGRRVGICKDAPRKKPRIPSAP